jgi:hypothetical protein
VQMSSPYTFSPRSRSYLPRPKARAAGNTVTCAKVSTARDIPRISPGQNARWKLKALAEDSYESKKMGANPITIVPLIVVAAIMAGPTLSPA